MKNKIMLAYSALVLVLVMTSVSACSCVAPRTIEQEINDSDFLFQGKVLKMEKDLFTLSYNVEFQVEKIWKGTEKKTVNIETGQDSAMCGYPFQEGMTYLVYAYETGEGLSANICSRTALIGSAKEDLEFLGNALYDYTARNYGDDGLVADNDFGGDDEDLPRESFFSRIISWFRSLF